MSPSRSQDPGKPRKRAGAKPRCEDCYFHQNMLCALGLDEPCPTFRPAHPDGLQRPSQLSFAFRHPRRPQLLALGAEAAYEGDLLALEDRPTASAS